jgi:RNA polymerase sigma factor (sigma-70 family)
MEHDPTAEDADLPSDERLLESARDGDDSAFAELWTRHSPAALRAATQFRYGGEPDDLVAEAYVRIFEAVRQGKGPRGAFRPYLLVTVRNLATRIAQSSREDATDDLEALERAEFPADPAVAALDRSLTVRAFRSLPERWQTVLWYTAVEGMSPREASTLLGLSPNSTAALAHRAREGLRQAWIQAHVNDDSSSPECRWMLGVMGRFVRHELPARDRKRAMQHLSGCQKCVIVSEEIDDISARLALVMIPLLLGGAAGTGYLATLHPAQLAAAHGIATDPSAGTVTGTAPTTGAATGAASLTGGATTWVIGAGIAAVVAGAGVWGVVALTGRSSDAPMPPAVRAEDTLPPTAPDRTPEPPPVVNDAPPESPVAPVTVKVPAAPTPAPTPAPTTPPTEPTEPEPEPEVDPILRAPVVTVFPAQNSLTRPELAGTGVPGAVVMITDQDDEFVGAADVDREGNWRTGPLSSLGPNATAIIVVQQDATGTTSAPRVLGPFAFRPTFLSAADPVTTSIGVPVDLEIAGWAGAQIVVRLDGEGGASGSFEFDDEGRQTRRVTFLTPGSHTIGIRYSGSDPSTEILLRITVTLLPLPN